MRQEDTSQHHDNSAGRPKDIQVVGATEHNLQGINVQFERQKITVITGVSGSGKSSLAFDTVLAEAQRRFFYTLSHYSRQFLDLQSRPAVKYISGLSPAISLAQNETQPSRRATVGTLTDISELIGVLFARFGEKRCPTHHLPTTSLSAEEITSQILEHHLNKEIMLCVALAESKKGHFRTQLAGFASRGYSRAYIDGSLTSIAPPPDLNKEEKHTIKVVIDHLKVKTGGEKRLLRSIEATLTEGHGFGEYLIFSKNKEMDLMPGGRFSTKSGCPKCGFSWPQLDSRYFSANSLGKCETCDGLGEVELYYDETGKEIEGDDWEDDEDIYVASHVCAHCDGTGLNPEYDSIVLAEESARSLAGMTVDQVLSYIQKLEQFSSYRPNPAFMRVVEEIKQGLTRVADIGIGYLGLTRRVRTLSGGEGQRLRLSGILAENLRGILYVLDEPSQGLHPSEIERVWRSLRRLCDYGNTILIVDHDEDIMKRADWIIDLGPGGGARGGRLIAKFKPNEAEKFAKISGTAAHLAAKMSAQKSMATKRKARQFLILNQCQLHNLKITKVRFPIGCFTVVGGVSGAGKSSLVLHTLYRNLEGIISGEIHPPTHVPKVTRPRKSARKTSDAQGSELFACKNISGYESFEQAHVITRKPIAKSSVSMPATYLDLFGDIRDLYAGLPEAQIAGLDKRSFSLNVEGGRCPLCKGRGQESLSMRFLADAKVTCQMCKGKRYSSVVLDVKFKDLNISDVLELTLEEAAAHFANHRKISKKLKPALDLGLGYLKLGQPSSSLSGGEAQRLKLVPFLNKNLGEGHLIILDEPTTGLHFEDVSRLLVILHRLTDAGATVVAIEHNQEFKDAADWYIELGPGAGEQGGQLISDF